MGWITKITTKNAFNRDRFIYGRNSESEYDKRSLFPELLSHFQLLLDFHFHLLGIGSLNFELNFK